MTDKIVPLVVYGPEGERKVLGQAYLKDDETVLHVTDSEMWDRISGGSLDYLSVAEEPRLPKGSDPMSFTTFIRRPFSVEAVEVTEENFDQIASMTGTIGTKEDGTRYIETNRTIVPNVFRIYVGFWVTRLDGNLRGYSAKTFSEMFQPEETKAAS